MKLLFFLLGVPALSCAFAYQLHAQAVELTNDDIISLSKAGLATEVIVAKIKSSPAKFDTSPEQLKRLKDEGVSDPVTLAVVQYPMGGNSAKNDDTDSEVLPNESNAIVYVYRRKEFSTRNMQPSVYVDDKEVARMDDGKFFIVRLTPGKHNVVVNKGFEGRDDKRG